MATTFQTGNTVTEGVTRFLLDIPVTDAWVRAAVLQAILLMCDENNWYEQGDITVEQAVDIASDMFSSARFEDV